MKTQNAITILKGFTSVIYYTVLIVLLLYITYFLFGCFNVAYIKFDNVKILPDLSVIRAESLWNYVIVGSIYLAKVILIFLICQCSRKAIYSVNFEKPFLMKTVILLERITFYLFVLWIIGGLSTNYADNIISNAGNFDKAFKFRFSLFSSNFNYLISAAVLFLFTNVFKVGIALQEEKELTI